MLHFPQKHKISCGTPRVSLCTVWAPQVHKTLTMTQFYERMNKRLVTETEQVTDNEQGRERE